MVKNYYSITKRLLIHATIFAAAFGYMVLGGYIFCIIEGWKESEEWVGEFANRNLTAFENTKSAKKPGWTLLDGFLYSYSTVTTIGYSHLYTTTEMGRIYYVFFGLFGIILFALAINDLAYFMEEFFAFVLSKICRKLRNRYGYNLSLDGTSCLSLPTKSLILLPVILVLFMLYLVIGGLILPIWEEGWDFVLGFYVAFDAITTVGIGDVYPRNERMFLATIAYFTLGIALGCAGVGALGDLGRRLHFLGVKPRDCSRQLVHFHGRCMPVGRLVELVGRELGATDYEVQNVRRSLDRLVRDYFFQSGGSGCRQASPAKKQQPTSRSNNNNNKTGAAGVRLLKNNLNISSAAISGPTTSENYYFDTVPFSSPDKNS